MAKIKKGRVVPNQVDKAKKNVSDDELKRLLLFRVDEQSNNKGTDEVLDKLNEKSALIANTEHPDLIGQLQAYEPKFPLEFYRQIFKLWGWKIDSDQSLRKRPGVVAKITAYLIYMRFPKGTLKELQTLNQKTDEGDRLFKHFQFFTPEGERLLKQYIKESTDLMKECSNWHQFIRLFTQKYSNPYNLTWEKY